MNRSLGIGLIGLSLLANACLPGDQESDGDKTSNNSAKVLSAEERKKIAKHELDVDIVNSFKLFKDVKHNYRISVDENYLRNLNISMKTETTIPSYMDKRVRTVHFTHESWGVETPFLTNQIPVGTYVIAGSEIIVQNSAPQRIHRQTISIAAPKSKDLVKYYLSSDLIREFMVHELSSEVDNSRTLKLNDVAYSIDSVFFNGAKYDSQDKEHSEIISSAAIVVKELVSIIDSIDNDELLQYANARKKYFTKKNAAVLDSMKHISLVKNLSIKGELAAKRDRVKSDSLRLESVLSSISRSEFIDSDNEVVVSEAKPSKVFTTLPKGNYVKVASKNLDILAINNIIFSPTEKVYTDLNIIENSYKNLTQKNAHSKTLAVLEEAMSKLGGEYICVVKPRGIDTKLDANEKILSAVIKEFNSETHQSPSHGYVASIVFLTYGKNTGASIDSRSAEKEYANYKTIQYRMTEKTRFEIYKKR